MTSTVAGLTLDNSPAPSAHVQADFYAKLAHLQNKILAGEHPRYKFSGLPAVAKPPSVLQPQPHLPAHPLPPIPPPSAFAKLPLPNGGTVPHTQQAILPPLIAKQQNGIVASPQTYPGRGGFGKTVTSATIDPVLLTKSDDLVRAENHLKRMRIEKALKEAASVKNVRAPEKDLGVLHGAQTFDGGEVLEAAIALVKPVTGLPPIPANEPRPRSTTPNTNSYYSSRGDSRSPIDEGEIAGDGQHVQAKALADPYESAVEASLQRPRMSGLGPQSSRNPPPARANTVFPTAFRHTDAQLPLGTNGNRNYNVDLRGDSYSPPEPPHSVVTSPNFATSRIQNTNGQAQTIGQAQQQTTNGRSRDSESYSPPPPDFEVQQILASLQNEQTSNQGRKPKRMPKGMRAKMKDAAASEQQPLTLSAANSQPQLVQGRKRRRNDEVEVQPPCHAPTGPRAVDTSRPPPRYPPMPAASSAQRYRSPSVPYIKSEPVSPRLAARTMPNGPRRLVIGADGTANLESVSAEDARRAHAQARARAQKLEKSDPQQEWPRARYVQPEPIFIDDSDMGPPPPRRMVQRGEPDLRRVASLQHARRPMSPEYAPPAARQEVRYAMTPSRQVSEMQPRYDYGDGHYRPPPSPAFVHERHSSPMYADEYASGGMVALPPPAKRRIVVDKYGNEYMALASPSSGMRQSSIRELEPREYVEPPIYDRPTYQPRPSMPPPGMYERQMMSRQPREVIDLVDDEEDWVPVPRSLHPGKQRMQLVPQHRAYPLPPPQQQAGPPRAVYYTPAPQPAPRAVSMQPYPQQQQHVEYAQRWPMEPEMRPMRQMSARPREEEYGVVGVPYGGVARRSGGYEQWVERPFGQ